MRCTECDGKGFVDPYTRRIPEAWRGDIRVVTINLKEPCPECQGTGQMHCCEGANVDMCHGR